MLIGALVAGLVLGLVAGGRLDNLASVRLRWVMALFVGLFLRYAVQLAIEAGNAPADALRLPLFTIAFALVLTGLWVNRDHPGIPLAFVGILLNAVAMMVNGGHMPVWGPAIAASGLSPADAITPFHIVIDPGPGGAIGADFLVRAIPLGDIVPIPVPGLRNVASLGDFFLAGGLAFFLFASTVRRPGEHERATGLRALLSGFGPGRTARGVEATLEGAAAFEPLAAEVMGANLGEGALAYAGGGIALPAAPGFLESPGYAEAPAAPAILDRARNHPYVRLALDSSFSALWTGQLISLIGDRVHQVALAFLVLRATNSAVAVGAVFLVSTLPNLVLGPLVGPLVDRWDHREVMVVSDLLRAGVVILIPIAAVTNLALVYPLVFLVTTISLFFRPAKSAILPRMVAPDDLVAANSSIWLAETFADIGGFALAGLFVALLGSQLPLAFWVDAATYLASAVLIATIAVAPLRRGLSAVEAAAAEAAALAEAESPPLGADTAPAWPEADAPRSPGYLAELREGWRFLRNDAVLLANTLQAAVAQLMLGIFLALTPVYADHLTDRAGFDATAGYSFMEGSIGAGNLIGGFVIGLIGSRIALGRMVILGYAATGLTVAALALTGNLWVAVGLAFGTGVGNLAFVIPTQTLFQRRTPPELMGRVLSLRFALVFGSMTLAMGVGGVLGQLFGAAPVIGVFGLVTALAGLAGLLVPAVRDA
ncbi:MAG TPA: MFS transporter [Candidatus Limnocylindrales bacterium]